MVSFWTFESWFGSVYLSPQFCFCWMSPLSIWIPCPPIWSCLCSVATPRGRAGRCSSPWKNLAQTSCHSWTEPPTCVWGIWSTPVLHASCSSTSDPLGFPVPNWRIHLCIIVSNSNHFPWKKLGKMIVRQKECLKFFYNLDCVWKNNKTCVLVVVSIII